MNVLKKWNLLLLLVLLMVVVVTACAGNNVKTNDEPQAVADQEKNTEDSSELPSPEAVDVTTLPETKNLEIIVEGEPGNVASKLTISEQGYAFYLMEGFEFAVEEPGKDMIFNKNFPEYYTRVEMLPSDTSIEEIKAASMEQLKATGEVFEMKGEEINAMVRENAKFFLHASNSELSRNIVLIENNGSLFLFTLNFPNGEAAEGITPRFYPMINSVIAAK